MVNKLKYINYALIQKIPVKSRSKQLRYLFECKHFLKNKNPIFSVNASFFDTQTLEPVGNIISGGELLHLSSYSRPALIINEKNEVDIDYVKLEYQMEINGLLFWVKSINSNWKGDVKLYTYEYKGKIEENEDNYVFLLFNKNNELISKKKLLRKKGKSLF